MAFRKANCSAKVGEYLAITSSRPPKSILSMKTTPANRIIKASHGSIPGISFNKKNMNKKAPIPSLTNESITSLVLG
jgi:hypothetical protein